MKRRKFLQHTVGLSAGLTALSFENASPQKPQPPEQKLPNILFIMTDQLRYDCIGANGNKIIQTPHLDRLSKQSAMIILLLY